MTNDQVQVFRYSKVRQLYDLEVTAQIFQFADLSSTASIGLPLSRAIFYDLDKCLTWRTFRSTLDTIVKLDFVI